MDDNWNDLYEGEIHVRDNLQFELKSEFSIHPHLKKNSYKQEVFLFIPQALQIDSQTYSKEQFYLDETNIIRYKTPSIDFSQLIDPSFEPSPLNRIDNELNHPFTEFSLGLLSDEVKLFGAIFKANMRQKVQALSKQLIANSNPVNENLSKEMSLFITEITEVCSLFRSLQKKIKSLAQHQELHRYFKYVDEIISTTVNDYLLLLLKYLRKKEKHHFHQIDKQLCALILKEIFYRKRMHLGPQSTKGPIIPTEMILYRQRILNRFVMESLRLKSYRFSVEERHSDILGAFAAGIAMFIYMGLLVWKSSTLVINSFPFVALAVVLYILKDRVKEGLKRLYHKQISHLFPDYSTVIKSPKNYKVGRLTENVNFISMKQLPREFLHIRNHQFHEELQALRRQESIMHYKREVILNNPPGTKEKGRRKELTTIFRFNLHHFLRKAGNPYQEKLTLDPYSHSISEKMLPKVYHINIIIRNTFLENDSKSKSEIKTFRVVVDKRGIKRVEHIGSTK